MTQDLAPSDAAFPTDSAKMLVPPSEKPQADSSSLLDVSSPSRRRAESEVSHYYDAQSDSSSAAQELAAPFDSLSLSGGIPDTATSYSDRPGSSSKETIPTSPPTSPSRGLLRRVSNATARPLHHRKTSSSSSIPAISRLATASPSLRQQIGVELRQQTSTPIGDSNSVAAEHLLHSTPPFTPNETVSRPELPGRARSFSRTKSLSSIARMEPDLPDFMVSAPAKVIMYGEHAVVHGKVCDISDTITSTVNEQ